MNKSGFPNSLTVLQYHNVTPRFSFGGTCVTPQQFRYHLKKIKDLGVLSLNPLKFNGNTGKISVLITFDDGYEDVYWYAYPLMEDMGYKAIVFVVAKTIGKYNNWDANFGRPFKHLNKIQISELISSGWVLGSHSLTHPDLTRIGLNRLRKEVQDSKKMLEDMFGEEVRYFSYPFGRLNRVVREVVSESGYELAFSSYPWTREPDPMVLPRRSVYLFDIGIGLKLDVANPLNLPLGYLQILINSFANLTGLARHRIPLLAKISGMDFTE